MVLYGVGCNPINPQATNGKLLEKYSNLAVDPLLSEDYQ